MGAYCDFCCSIHLQAEGTRASPVNRPPLFVVPSFGFPRKKRRTTIPSGQNSGSLIFSSSVVVVVETASPVEPAAPVRELALMEAASTVTSPEEAAAPV